MCSNDIDDFNEKIFIGNIVKKQTKYGSFSNNNLKEVRYIKHILETSDTLQGLALRYNVSMEMIKRANNLWTSDSLFSRTSLNIPIEYSKRIETTPSLDVHDSILECDEISLEENGINEGHKIDSKVKGEKENVFLTNMISESKKNGHMHNPEESLTDFLMRIDNHIASYKHSVNSITQNKKPLSSNYSEDELTKRKSKSSSNYIKRHSLAKANPFSYSSLSEQELPKPLFMNHGRKVMSSLKKLEKQQDEIYQL